MTAEEGRGRRGHAGQVLSNMDREDCHRDRHGDREAETKGWSGRSDEASDKETEEDGMPTGEQEGS